MFVEDEDARPAGAEGEGLSLSEQLERAAMRLGAVAKAPAPAEEAPAEPKFYDRHFRRKRKHGKYQVIDDRAPALEGPVADTHAHLGSLSTADLALARAAAWQVDFICCITDITDDAADVYPGVDGWRLAAGAWLDSVSPDDMLFLPEIRLACGCHPHNARLYDNAIEAGLLHKLRDGRTCCLGEIGLDYHYNLSPRDVQKKVFRRQLMLAERCGLPVSLHVREAHGDALAILDEVGMPEAGAILHCFNLGPDDLKPWIERGCYISIGGPVTFNKAEDVREAVRMIPLDRLLTETDCPYMTPEPMRGMENEPACTVWTAERIASVRGVNPGDDRRAFLAALMENARGLLDRGPTSWQMSGR